MRRHGPPLEATIWKTTKRDQQRHCTMLCARTQAQSLGFRGLHNAFLCQCAMLLVTATMNDHHMWSGFNLATHGEDSVWHHKAQTAHAKHTSHSVQGKTNVAQHVGTLRICPTAALHFPSLPVFIPWFVLPVELLGASCLRSSVSCRYCPASHPALL